MSNTVPPFNSLKDIIHDLNGEVFLIRGYVELSLGRDKGKAEIEENMMKILKRTKDLEALIAKLNLKQKELEP